MLRRSRMRHSGAAELTCTACLREHAKARLPVGRLGTGAANQRCLRRKQLEDRMISRTILAAIVAAGMAGAALAEVQVKTPGVDVKAPAGGVELDIDIGKTPPSDAWIGRAVYSADDKHL